jgi:hypothetical protein
MNDKTDVFVRRFRVGEHSVIMTMSRRKFRRACMTCRWTPTKPTRFTKEEKCQYRSGREWFAAVPMTLELDYLSCRPFLEATRCHVRVPGTKGC